MNYAEVEAYLRRALGPAFGKISGAADPSPSPDGGTIAFTGSKLEKLEGLPISRICLVDVEGGPAREITAGPNDDRLPRWSPDGRRLAFLSDRAEKGRTQLYTLDADAIGEARPAPPVPGSVEYHEWSPGGDRILLGVAAPGADLAGVQGSGVVEEGEKDSPGWQPSVESSAEREGWRRAWVHEVASGKSEPASREGLNVWEATWLGDRALAAIVSEDPGEDSWYTASLASIDLESGQERILYKSEVQLGLTAASRTGHRLAVVEAICSDRLVVAGDLLLIDPEDGVVTPIDTAGVDVTHVRWRDEERLSYIGIRGLDTVAGEYDMASGKAAETWVSSETSGFVYPDLAPLGDDAFVTVVQSYRRHPEVALVQGSVRPLTTLAHEGSAHVLEIGGSLERVSWKAKDGLEIQGLLLAPPGDGPHPLLAWVHGGPVSATVDEWSMHSPLAPLLVSRGYAILYPNPRGSTGRGQAFVSMVYGDMGGGDADDILAGIDAMVEGGVADPGRLGVIGGSYGGFMACWLVTQTDRLAAAVAISPVTDWYSQHLTSNIGFWDRLILRDDLARPGGEYFARSPIVHAGRARTPTLLTAGTEDECTPPGQAVEFHRALREQGVETELALYPGEGHGVRKLPARIDFFARIVGWFERHMPA